MVMATICSIDFDWYSQVPQVMKGDDPQVFEPTYRILPAPKPVVRSLKSKFADLPSSGIWEDRTESDDELLEQLGGDWRGFATGR